MKAMGFTTRRTDLLFTKRWRHSSINICTQSRPKTPKERNRTSARLRKLRPGLTQGQLLSLTRARSAEEYFQSRQHRCLVGDGCAERCRRNKSTAQARAKRKTESKSELASLASTPRRKARLAR